MFDQLSERLQGVLSDVRSRGKLSEDDVNKALRSRSAWPERRSRRPSTPARR
jgi:signal recognition particle GTPase